MLHNVLALYCFELIPKMIRPLTQANRQSTPAWSCSNIWHLTSWHQTEQQFFFMFTVCMVNKMACNITWNSWNAKQRQIMFNIKAWILAFTLNSITFWDVLHVECSAVLWHNISRPWFKCVPNKANYMFNLCKLQKAPLIHLALSLHVRYINLCTALASFNLTIKTTATVNLEQSLFNL